MLCPTFSLGHTNRQNLLYRITQEITGRPHERHWSFIPVHDHPHAVFIVCAPSLAHSNECKYVCGCTGSNKSAAVKCTFTDNAKVDPRLGFCRLDVILKNKTVKPLRALPSDPAAPISSNGVDTFGDWMRQQYTADRSHRINTEELIKTSQQAHLEREEKLQVRLRKSHAARAVQVTKAVNELSGRVTTSLRNLTESDHELWDDLTAYQMTHSGCHSMIHQLHWVPPHINNLIMRIAVHNEAVDKNLTPPDHSATNARLMELLGIPADPRSAAAKSTTKRKLLPTEAR
jgi:hypothetical protein